jgi:hypothetical protein
MLGLSNKIQVSEGSLLLIFYLYVQFQWKFQFLIACEILEHCVLMFTVFKSSYLFLKPAIGYSYYLWNLHQGFAIGIGIGWQNLELKDYYTVSKVSLGSLGKQGESGIWANANSEMEITFQRSLSKSKSPSLSPLARTERSIWQHLYISGGVSLLFIFSILSDCLCGAKMAGPLARESVA